MDKTKEKIKLIRSIEQYLDEIIYLRNNYVFESELEFETVKEIEIALGDVWLIYQRLSDKYFNKEVKE